MKRPEGFDGRQLQREQKTFQPTASKLNSSPAPKYESKPRLSRKRGVKQLRTEQRSLSKRGERANSTKEVRTAHRQRRQFEKNEIRRFTRRSRHRRLGWAIAGVTFGSLAALLAVAVYSPLLAVRTIAIEGTSSVDPVAIRNAIDGQLGTPLALIDYDEIRSQLDGFPLIRSFVTEVIPPATLSVRIVERVPIGVIQTDAGFTVVDPAGVILSSSAQPLSGLPIISVGSGDTTGAPFLSIVRVLMSMPADLRSQVGQARASSQDDVTLVLAGSGQSVVWGSAEKSALKARVLGELIATQGAGSAIEYDVSAPLSPVVRQQ